MSIRAWPKLSMCMSTFWVPASRLWHRMHWWLSRHFQCSYHSSSSTGFSSSSIHATKNPWSDHMCASVASLLSKVFSASQKTHFKCASCCQSHSGLVSMRMRSMSPSWICSDSDEAVDRTSLSGLVLTVVLPSLFFLCFLDCVWLSYWALLLKVLLQE